MTLILRAPRHPRKGGMAREKKLCSKSVMQQYNEDLKLFEAERLKTTRDIRAQRRLVQPLVEQEEESINREALSVTNAKNICGLFSPSAASSKSSKQIFGVRNVAPSSLEDASPKFWDSRPKLLTLSSVLLMIPL